MNKLELVNKNILEYLKDNDIHLDLNSHNIAFNYDRRTIFVCFELIESMYCPISSDAVNCMILHEIGHFIDIERIGRDKYKDLYITPIGCYRAELSADNNAKKLAKDWGIIWNTEIERIAIETYKAVL